MALRNLQTLLINRVSTLQTFLFKGRKGTTFRYEQVECKQRFTATEWMRSHESLTSLLLRSVALWVVSVTTVGQGGKVSWYTLNLQPYKYTHSDSLPL